MEIEDRLRQKIKYHLERIYKFDPYTRFGVDSNKTFLEMISKDPAFAPFHLAREKYVIARIGGNLVTSVHRKLGDIYEDIVKEILSRKLKLPRASLEYALELTINNQKQRRSTDGRIILDEVEEGPLRDKIIPMVPSGKNGLVLEIRSCYQIGDSKRIQADENMALALQAVQLHPVMLVFCITSLRSPLERLKKIWELKEGFDAFNYVKELSGFDLYAFLCDNSDFIKERMEKVFNLF